MQEDEEYERQQLIVEIAKEIKPQHPISYDAFNLCEYAQEKKKLSKFNVAMLKQICRHFAIPVKSNYKKIYLIEELMSFVEECTCFE